VRIAVTSVACENLAKHNVAKPNGWRYFTIHDRVRINEWNPNMVVCLGWFCTGWSEWQNHKACFGDTKKIIIQWVGSDILVLKQAYDRGHKAIVEWLKDPRFLHVAPTQESIQEMAWTGFKFYGPVDVPAEHLIDPQPMPEKVRLAIYMPPNRQDFYGIKLMIDVLPKFKDVDIVFYHWLPQSEGLQYGRRHEEHFALTREEYEEKILAGCSALVRIPVHDAGSISVGEFLMAGKPVITNQSLPHWKYGIKGNLYVTETGDAFALAPGAHKKFEAEVARIIDLVKNSKEPVPQKTMDYYREAYDPANYAKKLSEYTQDHWGVSIEPSAG